MHAKDFYDHISTSRSQDELHHSGSPLVCQRGPVRSFEGFEKKISSKDVSVSSASYQTNHPRADVSELFFTATHITNVCFPFSLFL